MPVADEVSYYLGRLGLAKALHDLKAGKLFKLPIDFGIERLSCGGHMLYAGKVVFGDILFDHHPQHCRRSAKRSDIVLCEHGEYLGSVKPIKVVNECCRLAEPLTIELTPHRLCPAGIRNREVKAIGVDAVPILRGVEVAKRIFIVVSGYLGITRRSRCEEHEHIVVAARGVLGTLKAATK